MRRKKINGKKFSASSLGWLLNFLCDHHIRTHFTPFCRVILAISFPYEQETLVGHQPSRNSHGREKFPHQQLQTQQGQSAIYAFHHRKYKNLWPHLHIYTFLPKLIYAREKENSFSLQRATAKGDEEKRKLFFSPHRRRFTWLYLLDGLLTSRLLLLLLLWCSNRFGIDESWRFRRWWPSDSLQTCQR